MFGQPRLRGFNDKPESLLRGLGQPAVRGLDEDQFQFADFDHNVGPKVGGMFAASPNKKKGFNWGRALLGAASGALAARGNQAGVYGLQALQRSHEQKVAQQQAEAQRRYEEQQAQRERQLDRQDKQWEIDYRNENPAAPPLQREVEYLKSIGREDLVESLLNRETSDIQWRQLPNGQWLPIDPTPPAPSDDDLIFDDDGGPAGNSGGGFR